MNLSFLTTLVMINRTGHHNVGMGNTYFTYFEQMPGSRHDG